MSTTQTAKRVAKKIRYGKRERLNYSQLDVPIEMPYLISIQKDSYKKFLETGIWDILKEFSPIVDFSGKAELSFISCRLETKPKYDKLESKRRGATYSTTLQVLCRLANKETGSIVEKEVYLGDIPLMTDEGSFVINGVERVIVSQIVRSPSVYFKSEIDKTGTHLFNAQMMPNRGTWIEFERTSNGIIKAIVDRSNKISLGIFLKGMFWSYEDQKSIEKEKGLSFGETNSEYFNDYIKELFNFEPLIVATIDKEAQKTPEEALIELSKKLRPTELPNAEVIKNYLNLMFFSEQRYDLARVGRYKFNNKLSLANRIIKQKLAKDVQLEEKLIKAGTEIDRDIAWEIQNSGINEVYVDVNGNPHKVIGNNFIELTNFIKCQPEELGITGLVYYPALKQLFKEYKTKQERLDAIKLTADSLMSIRNITLDDITATISFMLDLENGFGSLDNIDHLANRRVCTVGELMSNHLRIGLTKLVTLAKESMQGQDLTQADPTNIVNARQINKALKDFVGNSQLSQLMDQFNPISELTQKRRLSAVGPGGIKKERASPEVRDIHYTHYGRICPVETPEGQSVGLINSLAIYAKINEFGFIQAPYRKLDKETGLITNHVDYLMADEEEKYIIAQADEPRDDKGGFLNDRVVCRFKDRIIEVAKERVDYMDVSPRQLLSAATTIIPFLENTEAKRALMGSNMQRQAVPLLTTEAPIIGTGMEERIARDSGAMILSDVDGVVDYVSSQEVKVLGDDKKTYSYKLIKFSKTNHDTALTQKPCVTKGERVKKGEVVADGFSTNGGELALGKNMLIAFMNWEGYNYEDSILISERLVKEDVFTSLTIKEEECKCRATKLGDEEITRDIPNLSEEALKNLDEEGIIRIGAEVRSGDILVGKITPKGETELTPEERLLRAIFGEKAREVRDTSLRVQHGHAGVVVDVQIFSRKNKDELDPGVNTMVKVYIAQKRKISVGDKMSGRYGNKGVVSRILPVEDMPYMANGQPLDIILNTLGVPSRMNLGQVLEVHLGLVAKALGIYIATPVFDGVKENDIQQLLIENGFSGDGKMQLFDGRTGLPFDRKTTVGYMYMIKLEHMVDNKMHARSTGPYALVTQQPLGGKAMFGGQRFGEMEVWAIEAYGAANILQELLTVKSDDVIGRTKTYEAIVKGEPIAEPGIPEAFKVLIKEFQSLGLDMKILNQDKKEISINELVDDEVDMIASLKERDQELKEIDLGLDTEEVTDLPENEKEAFDVIEDLDLFEE